MSYEPEAPITPEQQSAIAGYAQKLNEMTGGASGKAATEKQAAAAKRAEPAAPQPAATENQKAIAKLNAPDSDLWSKDEAKQKAAYAKLRVHLAAEATADEKQAIADAPIGQLREQYGIETGPPSFLAERWDEHGEGVLLATLSQQGAAPDAVKALHAWYSDVFTGALGNAANLEDVDALAAEARVIAKKHGVSDDVIETLIDHERKRLGR